MISRLVNGEHQECIDGAAGLEGHIRSPFCENYHFLLMGRGDQLAEGWDRMPMSS
jgi:hypothetical protein